MFTPPHPLPASAIPRQMQMQVPRMTNPQVLVWLCNKGTEIIANGTKDFNQVIGALFGHARTLAAQGRVESEQLALSLAKGPELGVLLCLSAGLDAKEMQPFISEKYHYNSEEVVSRLSSVRDYDEIFTRFKFIKAFRASFLSAAPTPPEIGTRHSKKTSPPQQDILFPPSSGSDDSRISSTDYSIKTPVPVYSRRRAIPYINTANVNLGQGTAVRFRRVPYQSTFWYEYFDGVSDNRYPIFLHRDIASRFMCGNYLVYGQVERTETVSLNSYSYGLSPGSKIIIVTLIGTNYTMLNESQMVKTN